jgi:hypothetical protein
LDITCHNPITQKKKRKKEKEEAAAKLLAKLVLYHPGHPCSPSSRANLCHMLSLEKLKNNYLKLSNRCKTTHDN